MNAGAAVGGASDPILRALERLEALDPLLLHAVLGFGAFLENVFPPVPADTFIAVGGVLSGRGAIPLWSVALVVGLANVGGAWLVYLLGRRYGHAVFAEGPGRWILNAEQLERAERWHARKGGLALFLLRFLPALRAAAPAFAGIGGLSARRVAIPLVSASLLWYGGLLWAGHVAGQNLEALARWIGQLNTGLTVAAIGVVLGTLWWWRTSRRAGKG
jgi:membrane protein DedA with SNARE-associated domain